MSAVGYEGHIWEELFGGINIKKFGKYLILFIIVLGAIVAYLIFNKLY